MYNEGVKNAFIEKAKAENNTGVLKQKYIFNKTERFEEKLQKDIALFNKNELSDMYTELDGALKTLLHLQTFLRKYAKYYSDNFFVYCPVSDMTQKEAEIAYNRREKKKINKNVFPVKYFLNRIDELKNPSDQFLMYGLFQGVRGVSNCELAFSTMEDCDFAGRKIWLPKLDGDTIIEKGRLYEADKKLFDYAVKASSAYTYYTYELNREQRINLVSNRIIKMRVDSGIPSSEVAMTGKTRIDKRLRVLLKHMGLNDYCGLDIYKAGLAYYIKKICLEYGISDILDVFETEEYKKLQQQYDLTDNNRNVRRLLKGFL